MANPTISQIKVGDITYDTCDENLRNTLFNSSTLDFENIRTINFGDSSATDGTEFQFRVKDSTFPSGVYFMKIITGPSGSAGDGIIIDAGGLTCIGGGEAGRNLYAALTNGGTTSAHEQLHLGSDNEIQFHSNCQTVANRKTMILDTSGNLNVPGNIIPKSQTKNTVFAAPSNANGAPSFRALVAADIPAHSTDKLTSGTLPLGRGGTGATTKVAAFKKLGAWTSIATTSGTTAKTFSDVATAGYSELLIVCKYSSSATTYNSSVVVPVGDLDTTDRWWYLGGGWWDSGYGAACKLTKTKITPDKIKVASGSVNASWVVYAR